MELLQTAYTQVAPYNFFFKYVYKYINIMGASVYINIFVTLPKQWL